jgi:hypothetical protein
LDDHVVVVEGVEPLQVAAIERLHQLAGLDPLCLIVHLRSLRLRAFKP